MKWVVLTAIAVAVVAALWPESSYAHHTSGFFWSGWWQWNGYDFQWCTGLFNQAHQLIYYYCR